MKYEATVAVDAFNRREGKPHHVASVGAPPIADEALALRHARAMKAVIVASKALDGAQRAENRAAHQNYPRDYLATLGRLSQAQHRHAKAVAHLVAVEKEVGRG
jgi:hypothetical protein